MENNRKILLVEDDLNFGAVLKDYLVLNDFDVTLAKNGMEGFEKFKKDHYDLCILDVMMPEMDGIDACTEIRTINALKDSLIIFLTARSEDYSQIAGYDAGADDYISKPIKPRLLISKINSLFRRFTDTSIPNESQEQISVFNAFTIDRERYIILKDENQISLPKKEFELLLLLTSKPNKVFTREEIFNEIWGNQVIVGDRTIDVHMRKIREKIDVDCIKTVKGVGYKFEDLK